MKTMHLFAGAGGGLLADLILGHEPVVAVEWNKYACQVLRERAAEGWFPGLYVHEGDIKLFDPSEYAGRVDSIHAGFPCQDISVAGAGAGITGKRSGLWSEVVRIADALRPEELLLENSPAITSRGLGTVLGDLACLGYDARWIVLGAAAVGAPHLRARWWCLARRAMAYPVRQRLPESTCGRVGCVQIPTGKPKRCKSGRRNATQGTYWSTEPDVGRVAHGIPARVHRLEGLGNAQVPLQAAVAYQILSRGDI